MNHRLLPNHWRKTVLDYFLGVERPPGREVVTYTDGLVECYIDEYCLPQKVSQKIMDNGKRASKRSHQKK